MVTVKRHGVLMRDFCLGTGRRLFAAEIVKRKHPHLLKERHSNALEGLELDTHRAQLGFAGAE